MAQELFDVNTLKIAKPCTARWSEMDGDERARFCGQCKKSVYNVEGMTRLEVTELIQSSRTMPCLRLRRRADGTVMTGDCPVGWALVRRRMAVAGLMGLLVLFGGIATAMSVARGKQFEEENLLEHLRTKPVVGAFIDQFWPIGMPAVSHPPSSVVMGEIGMPIPSPAASSSPPRAGTASP